MERSEPTLIPEWLKGSGSISGGTTSHQMVASSLHSDDRVASKPSRNKSSISINGHDAGRSSVSDRTTSAYFRRSSSSNGSSHVRSHGSLGRGNHDKDWEKEIYDFRDKEKSILGDHRRREYSDPLENILPSRFEKDMRRSQLMTTGKQGEIWPRKVPSDLSNANKSNPNNSNGLLAEGSAVSRVHKAAFDRDFPSLGAEERQAASEIGRVSSPGLSTPLQSLPIGHSAVIRGDGWTSALAEVPLLVGSNVIAGSVQQAMPPASSSLASSMVSGMNMAETLVQGPPRAHTCPQLSAETQKMEELAIKQSRQLIPMTPSMPKALVLNPSEKPKLNLGHQLQHQHQISSSHPTNQSPRNGSVKSDLSRTSSVGKLHVLKPVRERNGLSPTAKDSSSPTSVSRVASSPVAVAPSVVGSAPLRVPSNNPNLASAERKPALLILEKKPTPQSQSRNDFFNLVRKKSMTNSSSPLTSPGLTVSSSVSDKSGEAENGSVPNMSQDGDSSLLDSSFGDQTTEKRNDVKSNGIASNKARESLNGEHQEHLNNRKDHSNCNAILCSEEEEAAFLRSLGWEEHALDDGGLTEEEINSWVDKYIKLRPCSKILQRLQLKFLVSLNLREGSVGADTASGSISSNVELES
ncbi:ADP-ribosylation factor GTPase-activating protein effector protein like [Actinidia chinensis var. chinensis]|uniref:ADP-ribosylation factor GTPase-activating protein effector protein like n=1 Tax=Actinidia chinensis var. chinensis TaxID=1590841 RepID=A0A2R6Q6G3_ACTCC|nr:ADP-ribosylation factor GTPase-activating protein effector protein like [Actinidia chinensis var. chinensis]